MLKAEKVEYLKDFAKGIRGRDLVIVDYYGMAVKQMFSLRCDLMKKGSKMTVIKNTLLSRSLKEQGIEMDESCFKGMSAVVEVQDSFSEVSKIIFNAEKDELLKIKGGCFEGNAISGQYIKKLASIPSKDVLYSILVGSLQSSVANLVYVLKGVAELKEKSPVNEGKVGIKDKSVLENAGESSKADSGVAKVEEMKKAL